MSYQSTDLEGSPMLTGFSPADTPKPEKKKKKSPGWTPVLVLVLVLASFLAGRATPGSTTAATATVSGSAAAISDCEQALSGIDAFCDEDTFSCFKRGANVESCPETVSPVEATLCGVFRDMAIHDCA